VRTGLPNKSKALWPSRSAAFRFVDEAPLERVEDLLRGCRYVDHVFDSRFLAEATPIGPVHSSLKRA
jgi:hypothetical protein